MDHIFHKRISEHIYEKDSVIHQHLQICQSYQHNKGIFNVTKNDVISNVIDIQQNRNNVETIDQSNHWIVSFLCKEVLAVTRCRPSILI